jgi:VWFA-related protein
MTKQGTLSGILAASLALAQAPPPAQPIQPQTPVVLKATTRLVQVSVIVQRHGQPVADLKKEDFQVKDNGKPQKISLFNVESSSASALPQSFKPLPPNIFTNELEQRPGTPASVTILLLDNTNTNLQNQMFARQQVLKYLQSIKPEDHIGIYRLANGLKVLHSYTTDSSDLIAMLGKYRGAEIPDLSKTTPSDLDTQLVTIDRWFAGAGASGAERDFYTVDRVKGTLKAIQFIANSLIDVPGRKNLIWVSGGFPLDINMLNMRDPSRLQVSFAAEIDECVRAVNNANLAIYPVDSRGLMTDHRFDAERQKVDLRANNAPPVGVRNQQTMEELASRTGGRAYYNTNDLKKAITDAIDDARVVYTLGFYPSDETFDGKFHKLEVKVPETGGLNLRYRKGYFDSPEAPTDPKSAHLELRDAVWSPIDATGAGLVVAAKPDPTNPTMLNMAIQIEPKNISLEPNGDRWAGRIDVLVVQKNDKGQQFNSEEQTIDLNLTRETYDKLTTKGFVFRKQVSMSPQAKMIRVIVRDAPSGTLGSVTIPFDKLK